MYYVDITGEVDSRSHLGYVWGQTSQGLVVCSHVEVKEREGTRRVPRFLNSSVEKMVVPLTGMEIPSSGDVSSSGTA